MKNSTDNNITKFLVFTLILLIVGIIVYPVYKTTKKEKEKENFEFDINNIITTAKEYYSNNTNFASEYIVFTIKDGKIIEDGLDYQGSLPDSGSILINKAGEVQIVASNKNWCAKKRYTDNILSVEEYSKNCEVIKSVKLGNIVVALSTNEDGLYQDGKQYYYRGENPNNYIELDGIMFRIISLDENKNIKVISNESLYNLTWSTGSSADNGYNIFGEDNLAYYLNYYETSNEKFDNLRRTSSILEYNWNNEKIIYSDNKLYSELKQNESINNIASVVGLPSALDYINASLDNNCILDTLRNNACGVENYLNISENYFTMSKSSDSVWAISSDGKLYETSLNMQLGVRPVVVLSNHIELSGKGTENSPYKIINK
jgi:hypothetical protein